MKKAVFLILILTGVISSSVDEIKKDINIYEDEEIVKQYIDHLDGIDTIDYTPSIKKSNLLSTEKVIDNNVISYGSMSTTVSPNLLSNVLDRFEISSGLKNTTGNNLSNISNTIDLSLEDISKQSATIENLFIDKNTDVDKFNKFRNDLINFANSKIDEIGYISKGTFINNENGTNTYNNIIEIDLE